MVLVYIVYIIFGVSKRWTLFDNGQIQDIFMHGCTKIKWHGVQIAKKIIQL